MGCISTIEGEVFLCNRNSIIMVKNDTLGMKKNIFLITIFSLIFFGNSAFAAKKKKLVNIAESRIGEYFLQFNLTQKECEKIIGGECFRRDHMRDEPYYHESRIIIFDGKIFAEQFFENSEKTRNMVFLKVLNGVHKAKTTNGNLISFAVKDGKISDLKILKGEISREKKLESKCDLSEVIFGFYQAYDKSHILQKSALFKDEYNFDGLQEVLLFVEKENLGEARVLLKNSARSFDAIKDIRICKIPSEENFLLKHFSDEECQQNQDSANAAECSKYSICEDYLVVKNCEIVLLKDAMR